MRPAFPINPAAIPAIRTRKALLVIDLQNDFIAPDGALPASDPEDFVNRSLELVKAFRESGAGDVVWVRSEFERHRSLSAEGEQIITANMPIRPPRPGNARGRPPTSREHDGAAMEADEEAFLSNGGIPKKPCVRKGTKGAELIPEAQEAVDTTRDIVFTKTHYSAFASSQQELVQTLRRRFVTELYVCGTLTNISIYATALDAGRHGYEMTIVEDCCGFRNQLRHFNAVKQLVQLTGSEVINASAVIEQLRPPPNDNRSSGLSPFISKMQLNRPSGSFVTPPKDKAPGPTSTSAKTAPPPPDRGTFVCQRPSEDTRVQHQQHQYHTPLEAESDSSPSDNDNESTRKPEKQPDAIPPRRGSANATSGSPEQGELSLNSPKGPPRAPGAPITKTENPTRVRAHARLRLRHSSSDKSSASPPRSPPKADSIPPVVKNSTEKKANNRDEQRAKRTKIEVDSDTDNMEKRDDSPKIGPDPDVDKITQQLSNSKIEVDPDFESKTKEPDSPRIEVDSDAEKMNNQVGSTVSEPYCEGDTHVITHVLPPTLAADAFERLLEEVSWAGMSHMGGEVPRRIAVQGEIDQDGNMPVYRHPADESPPLLPFSPTVLQIKTEIEKRLGHPLNHVLIQHYRGGNDYISEHSDKTLDIVPNSFIANVSLGAERTMVFRTKRPSKHHRQPGTSAQQQPASIQEGEPPESAADKAKRQIQRCPLPHNSLLRMGLSTNKHWLHAIRPDKRPPLAKAPSELLHSSHRISLTFRQIGTFINPSQTLIWGQGCPAKTPLTAQPVLNGQTPQAVRLLKAFSAENNTSDFDWESHYGEGFNVLHMGTPKRFCLGGGVLANARVTMALAELGISCAKGSVNNADGRFEDNDVDRTVVDGHGSILRYLDAVYGAGRKYDQLTPGQVARRFGLLERALGFWEGVWKPIKAVANKDEPAGMNKTKKTMTVLLWEELEFWEGEIKTTVAKAKDLETEKGVFVLGGETASPVDFALWPVLHDIVRVCGEGVFAVSFGKRGKTTEEGKEKEEGEGVRQEGLKRYYKGIKQRSGVRDRVLGVWEGGGSPIE
ncbi:hypothetical protein QBC36DRAFT_355945 [Triangularia setosa]|uniref:Fe2OG dioxygenase domain-containing protein n=1 Tax=Triangularia setosa TaxID=2587417 RepID=A0AAN6W4C2_9PEZI|nr:hypothetical protein QBC36DRAFT_355945 [Podospora setosa]